MALCNALFTPPHKSLFNTNIIDDELNRVNKPDKYRRERLDLY
jgi:hypothetical protein